MVKFLDRVRGSSKWQQRLLFGVVFCMNVTSLVIFARQWVYSDSYASPFFGENDANRRSPAFLLLHDVREAVRYAGGTPGQSLSLSEISAWEVENSCKSRGELLLLYKQGSFAINSESSSAMLQALFNEYANLHRTCIMKSGNLTVYYESRNLDLNCKYLVVESGTFGVGNGLLWLASAFVYALLTQRVMVIETQSTIHQLLCEPFPGSSWKLPHNFPVSSKHRWAMPEDYFPIWDSFMNEAHNSVKQEEGSSRAQVEALGSIIQLLDTETAKDWLKLDGASRKRRALEGIQRVHVSHREAQSLGDPQREPLQVEHPRKERKILFAAHYPTINSTPVFHSLQINNGWNLSARFFCNQEQIFLSSVKWLNLNSGCAYFLPDLYTLPSFEPILEELFPSRNVLTHIVRYLTLPVNSIWERVTDVHRSHFARAQTVIGLQVRYREGFSAHQTLNTLVNEKFTRCCTDQGFLPLPQTLTKQNSTHDEQTGRRVVVFIASLYQGLRDHLHELYTPNLGLNIVQLSAFKHQKSDLEGDVQSLIEILALSFSHHILTSPASKFGYIAQAYGGLQPWIINFNPSDSQACIMGQSSDACNQDHVGRLSCRYNRFLDGKATIDVIPYLKPCEDCHGMQLVPP